MRPAKAKRRTPLNYSKIEHLQNVEQRTGKA